MYRFIRIVSICLIFTLLVGIMPAAAQDDMTQANKEAVRNAVAETQAGNWQALYDLFPEHFMMNEGNHILADMTQEGVIFFNEMLLTGMPDLQIAADIIIAQNDWVAAELVFTGTFTNTLNLFGTELAPTNEIVTWTEMDFMRFEDSLIVETWIISDPMVMFSQLGMFPPEEYEDDDPNPILEQPAGYQLLSDDEWAATFASGLEERNVDLFTSQLILGVETSSYYTDTYIAWTNGLPISHTASVQAEEDAAFTGMIAQAMPDNVVSADIVVAEGDWVASLVTVSGTFSADTDFFGMPLTHTDEEIVWQLGIIDRFNADGQVTEEWNETDVTPLFVGLGLMPAMDEE